MIKGCRNYFSMFGMMIFSINVELKKLVNAVVAQIEKSVNIIMDFNNILLQQIFQKRKHKIAK